MTACLLDMWEFKSAWDPVYFSAEDFRRFEQKEIPLVFSDEDREEWRNLHTFDAEDFVAAREYPDESC